MWNTPAEIIQSVILFKCNFIILEPFNVWPSTSMSSPLITVNKHHRWTRKAFSFQLRAFCCCYRCCLFNFFFIFLLFLVVLYFWWVYIFHQEPEISSSMSLVGHGVIFPFLLGYIYCTCICEFTYLWVHVSCHAWKWLYMNLIPDIAIIRSIC